MDPEMMKVQLGSLIVPPALLKLAIALLTAPVASCPHTAPYRRMSVPFTSIHVRKSDTAYPASWTCPLTHSAKCPVEPTTPVRNLLNTLAGTGQSSTMLGG